MEATNLILSSTDKTICPITTPSDYLTVGFCGIVGLLILTTLICGIMKRTQNQPLERLIWWCQTLSAWIFCYGLLGSGWIYVKSLYKLVGTDHAEIALLILKQAEALEYLLPCILVSFVGITTAMIPKLINRPPDQKKITP